MPCNARVLVKAVVEIGNADLSAFKKKGPNRYVMGLISKNGPVSIEIVGDKAEIRSGALTWDQGLAQIKEVIKMLQGKGVIMRDIGQPETHRHDHVGPWQKRGIHG